MVKRPTSSGASAPLALMSSLTASVMCVFSLYVVAEARYYANRCHPPKRSAGSSSVPGVRSSSCPTPTFDKLLVHMARTCVCRRQTSLRGPATCRSSAQVWSAMLYSRTAGGGVCRGKHNKAAVSVAVGRVRRHVEVRLSLQYRVCCLSPHEKYVMYETMSHSHYWGVVGVQPGFAQLHPIVTRRQGVLYSRA